MWALLSVLAVRVAKDVYPGDEMVAYDHTRKGLHLPYIASVGEPHADLAKLLAHRIQVVYNHSPLVTVVQHRSILCSLGKAKRILMPEEY